MPLGAAAPGDDIPQTPSLGMLRLEGRMLTCSEKEVTATLRQERQHVADEVSDASRIDSLATLPDHCAVFECIK